MDNVCREDDDEEDDDEEVLDAAEEVSTYFLLKYLASERDLFVLHRKLAKRPSAPEWKRCRNTKTDAPAFSSFLGPAAVSFAG